MTVRNIETLRFIGVGSLFASAAGLVMMLGLEFQIANSAKADDDLPPTPGTVVENCGQAVNSQGENAGCPANTLGKKCKKVIAQDVCTVEDASVCACGIPMVVQPPLPLP